ncbi:MAG: hypothetical protein O2909_04370 [Chloroflexi bacterium]|nr:hypothetical protein [Chloroflexota bacterium]MDA1218657.1 hypothetical protein [Chloroflexota bacterium]
MTNGDPFRFWALQPDGERAFQAYEHINSYYAGCIVQYSRIYKLWGVSSAIANDPIDQVTFAAKRRAMEQVVRDIHYLLVSLQVIWKTLDRLCETNLYPHFECMASLRDKWQPYFEQYLEPRNTFEHFDDQVLGLDSRNNSPGFGLRLTPDGGFSLGSQHPVLINKHAQDQLEEFKREFETCVDGIVG